MDKERLEMLRKKIGAAEEITREDAKFLLEIVAGLEKKNSVLSHHVLELTEELENVKMDFGGSSR